MASPAITPVFFYQTKPNFAGFHGFSRDLKPLERRFVAREACFGTAGDAGMRANVAGVTPMSGILGVEGSGWGGKVGGMGRTWRRSIEFVT